MNILISIDDSAESRDAVSTAFELYGPNHDYSIVSVSVSTPVYLTGYPGGGFASSTAMNDAVNWAEQDAKMNSGRGRRRATSRSRSTG